MPRSALKLKKKDWGGSLSQRAYLFIRDGILKGRYPLGSHLSRHQIATELRMSLLPVSEAIQRLQSDGLLESRPRIGTVVKVPTEREIQGHYVVREALESQAARLCAERAAAGERAELRRLAEGVDSLFTRAAADKEAEPALLFDAQVEHLRLHMRIAECSGCAELCSAIEKNQVLVFNWLYSTAASISMPSDWHCSLIQAVTGNDPILADETMRKHVVYGLDRLLQWLDRQLVPARSSLLTMLTAPAGTLR